MSIDPKYLAKFEEQGFYHIYNRTNGSHKLCRNDDNYRFFMDQFEEYLCDVLEIYSYSILPSHFHYIVRVKQLSDIEYFISQSNKRFISVDKIVGSQFRSFFTGYTMAFNKYHNRQGALFNHRFRRVRIESREHLLNSIMYVHSNPAHHGITTEFNKYEYSSYPIILSDTPTKIRRHEVLALFGGKEEFVKQHNDYKITERNSKVRPL
jgi:putative transposase